MVRVRPGVPVGRELALADRVVVVADAELAVRAPHAFVHKDPRHPSREKPAVVPVQTTTFSGSSTSACARPKNGPDQGEPRGGRNRARRGPRVLRADETRRAHRGRTGSHTYLHPPWGPVPAEGHGTLQ
jgi:hypothetical protein